MSILEFAKPFASRLLALLAALNLAGLGAAATLGWNRASVENGAVENLQMVMLVAALAAGIVAAWRAAGPLRALLACWVAVMVLLIQREFDFSVAAPGSWLARLHDNDARLAFWLPVLAILIVWTLRHRQALMRAFRALRRVHLWPVPAIAVLMLGSDLAEKLAKGSTAPGMADVLVFMEELLELNAYGVIAAMALAFAVRVGGSVPAQVLAARNRLDPAG